VGPKNVALAGEIADGWIPIFFSPRRASMFREWLGEGFKVRGGTPARFDVMPMVAVVVGDDAAACRAVVKPRLAPLRGRHGRARPELLQRHRPALRVRGTRPSASRISSSPARRTRQPPQFPDALVDEVALCGPPARIREHLAEWTSSGVTTIMVSGDPTAVRTMAELAL
jgi:alkanesulfonate monooxygenase SsuD/methylene tetrahydromethanopterin reductase-like flavin-dependent oxidoreductase (luciferase family)